MGKALIIGLLGAFMMGCATPVAQNSPLPPLAERLKRAQVQLEEARRQKDQQNAGIDPDKEFASYRAQDTVEGYQEYLYRHHQGDKYYEEASGRLDQLLYPTGQSTQGSSTTLVSHPVSSPPSAPVVTREVAPVPAPPPLDPKTRDAMEHALKPLRLLAAAMETGMNYQQYGTRLVDAKMALAGAIGEDSLHIPLAFKSETSAIFDIYQDARLAWEWKIRQGTYCDRTDCSYSRDDSFVSALFSKYPFLRSTITQEAPGGIFLPNGIWAHSRALSLLWAEARAKTEKLAATVPPPLTTAAPPQTAEERLHNLKNLLDKKLITKDEYEKKRAEILKGM